MDMTKNEAAALLKLHERSGGIGSQRVYANIAAVAKEFDIEPHVLEGYHFDLLDSYEKAAVANG